MSMECERAARRRPPPGALTHLLTEPPSRGPPPLAVGAIVCIISMHGPALSGLLGLPTGCGPLADRHGIWAANWSRGPTPLQRQLGEAPATGRASPRAGSTRIPGGFSGRSEMGHRPCQCCADCSESFPRQRRLRDVMYPSGTAPPHPGSRPPRSEPSPAKSGWRSPCRSRQGGLVFRFATPYHIGCKAISSRPSFHSFASSYAGLNSGSSRQGANFAAMSSTSNTCSRVACTMHVRRSSSPVL